MLANAVVPMIDIELPVMVIALEPIVLIEAEVYRRTVPIAWRPALRGSLLANPLSTSPNSNTTDHTDFADQRSDHGRVQLTPHCCFIRGIRAIRG